MEIPLPKSGHWEKVKFGKNVDIEPLSNEYDGPRDVSLSTPKEGQLLQQEIETSLKLSLVVPEKLSKPDRLITEAKEKARKYHYAKSLISTDRNQLDIRVMLSNVDRALRLMDTLIKLLRARAHHIENDYDHMYAVIFDEKLRSACERKRNGFPQMINGRVPNISQLEF
jgi:hypothetical protein